MARRAAATKSRVVSVTPRDAFLPYFQFGDALSLILGL
jgi:hypothetical protein